MAANVCELLAGRTTTGNGLGIEQQGSVRTYHGVVRGTGVVSATVKVEVSNNNVDWLELGTITLSGTTRASDGFAADAPWRYARGNVTAISGTSAAVDLLVGF